jgi:hypothetical protein
MDFFDVPDASSTRAGKQMKAIVKIGRFFHRSGAIFFFVQ